MMYTYYCEDHREYVVRKESPGVLFNNGKSDPICPVCFKYLFWVPNGGTDIPPRMTACEP